MGRWRESKTPEEWARHIMGLRMGSNIHAEIIHAIETSMREAEDKCRWACGEGYAF